MASASTKETEAIFIGLLVMRINWEKEEYYTFFRVSLWNL